jgi:uncharacterized protein involved in outer membrane biogenesis
MQGERGNGKGLRIALAVFGALVLILGSIVVYFLLDTNRLKGPLAKLISAQTGRELTINGDLFLHLGRQLNLGISGAELANADWAADPAMVTVDRIGITVDVASLFDGPLLIEQLRIDGARVSLEEAADGAGNWQLFEDDAEEESGFAFDEGLPVVVRRLNVDDCLVTYSTPERSSPLRLEIASLDQAADADGFLDLSGQGVLEGRPVSIEGGIGPFAALLNARNFRHELAITIGDTQVRSRGSVGDLTQLEEIDLVFDVHEPDAGFYADLLGVPGALAGPIELEAELSPNRPGIAAEVSGSVGGFDLSLSGHVERPLELDGLKIEFEIAGPDLAVVGEILEVPGLPAGPFDAAGELRRSGGTVSIHESRLSAGAAELSIDAEFAKLPDPDGGTVRVNLKGPDLGRFKRLLGPLPGLTQQPFEATAALTQRGDGEEHVEASIGVGQNRLALDGILGSYPEFADSRFDVDLRGPDVQALRGPTARVTGPYRASGDLAWTGAVLEIEGWEISAGSMDVRASGRLENLPSLDGSNLHLNTAGPDLFALGEWMGTDALPHRPYSLSGRLSWRGKGLVVEDIKGRIGEVTVTASAEIRDPGQLADIQLDLDVEGPGLDRLLAEPLGFELDDTPFELSGKLRRRDAAIEASNLRYRSSKASIRIDGSLGVPPSFVGMKLAVAAEGPSLRDIFPEIPGYAPPNRSYRVSGRIERPGDHSLVFDEFKVESGGAAASASGVWDFPSEPEAARLVLQASGSDLNDLGAWRGLALPALPFTLDAGIDAAPGSIAVETLSASWGESDLRGHAKLDSNGKPRITAVVRSNRLDLNSLLRGEDDAADPVEEPASEGGRVIPDAELPLERLQSADVSLDLDISELITGSQTLEHLELDLKVQDGALRIEPLEFIESDGTVLLNLSLTPTEERPELDLALIARNVRLGFFKAEGQDVETLPPYDIDMSLESAGATTREIAADLSGSLRVESTGGLIVNSRVEAWFDDFFMQLFEAVLPDSEDDRQTRIDCGVLDASFERGMFRARPGLVVRTDRLNLFARGEVDLASERMDIGFRTEARRGVGVSVGKILNPFVRVGGTLGNPALRLDATGAVISGTAAWATFGGSIALRTLWDRIQGTRNPCVRMLEPEK